MPSKAELSINVVIGFAVMLLVIIVVAILIFGGFCNFGKFAKCTNEKGICKSPAQSGEPCGEGFKQIDTDTDPFCPRPQICCGVYTS